MTEFEFRRSARICSRSGQPIQRGDWFYSVLIEQHDGSLTREDIANAAWSGPPADCVGWWRGRVPDLEKGRVYWAPPEVLLSVFQHYLSQGASADLAYVLALVLIRKKILHIQDTLQANRDDQMLLIDLKTKQEYQVPVVSLTSQRIQTIQSELNEKLFTDQASVGGESPTETEGA